MQSQIIIDILHREIKKSTGCTDPGAVALAVARATRNLGSIPEVVEVRVSPNVFKNGVSVGIPGTDKKGLFQAAALGMFLSGWVEEDLGLLDHVDENIMQNSLDILDRNAVNVSYKQDVPDPLYVQADIFKGSEHAWTIIQGDYTNVIQEGLNGKVLLETSLEQEQKSAHNLLEFRLAELLEEIVFMDASQLSFLLDAAWINKEAANQGLKDSKTKMGPVYYELIGAQEFPFSAMAWGKLYTAAAAEARMLGLNVPIMAISGSGNHGITNFLGVLAAAETLKASREDTVKALAISSVITIYIKGYIKRMTAFCGCSVAAATGVTAGTVYLLGGVYPNMLQAMHSVLGALAGVVCDGAKVSCAYKLSTATAAAIEYAYLAKEKGVFIPQNEGIIAGNIEDTFNNLSKLNNPGMLETDKCLLEIIQSNQSGS
jgi:L-cysteine desulfidase